MKLLSVLKALPCSFFSRALYRQVTTDWRGIGLGYLLLLVILTWLPHTYISNTAVIDYVDSTVTPILNQLPVIDVVEGRIITEKNQPYTIINPQTLEPILIIDTSGRFTSLKYTAALALLTHDTLQYRTAKGKTEVESLEKDPFNYHFDPKEIRKYLSILKDYFWLVYFGIGMLCLFILRFIQTLLGFFLALMITNAKQIHLANKAVMRLTAVALTPYIVLATVVELLAIQFPLQGLVKILIAIGYIYFAVNANSTANKGA